MSIAERHLEHTKRIISYLSYLRDISRKVVYRSGFEKCLLNRKNGYALQTNKLNIKLSPQDTEYQKINSYFNLIEATNDKRLFLGFGTFVGKSERMFAAPLLILQCEISKDEQNQDLLIEPVLDTLNLNYDFISSLSTNYIDEEEGNFNPITDAERQVIEKIEMELEKFSSFDFEQLSNFSNIIFKELVTDLDSFREIKPLESHQYNYQKELVIYTTRIPKRNGQKSIFERPLVYIHSHHFFVNQIPDELSTYEALNSFVKDISQENDFQNPVVEKLLISALTNEQVEIKGNEKEEMKEIITNYIPLSLSLIQIRAIQNAFGREIFYVQGPPGTGKSHTISAIVLTALFENRKVLIVSQKQPALEVVKKKIDPYLSDDEQMIGISYYDKTARRKIKDYCNYLLNLTSQNINKLVNNLEKETDSIKFNLLSKIEERCKVYNKLETALNKQKEYKDLNDKFLKELKEFNNDYMEIPVGFRFRKITNIVAYNKVQERIFKISERANSTLATKLYLNKFKKHLREKFSVPMEWLNIQGFPFLSKYFIQLNQSYTDIQNKERELVIDIITIRKVISNLTKDITALQEKLIKKKYRFQVLSKIKQKDYQEELKKFNTMLFNTNSRIIRDRMQWINFDKVTDIIPFWTAEVRDLGRLFPLMPEIFDLVIVDEASQVNLAEILPAFYRGEKICILGDHHQLSLKSTGLTFGLSVAFDRLTWDHYNDSPGQHYLSYTEGTKKCLTVAKASILDFIRNPDYNAHIHEIMLDEHFRSLPQLAQYTSREYYPEDNYPDGKLKIMTETPDKLSLKCFEAIRVNGKRETVTNNKFVRAEADKVIELIANLTATNIVGLFPNNFSFPEHIDKEKFTIGVISMLRDQCNLIDDLAEEKLSPDVRTKHELMIGTPEQFQGNERDIMIFSLCLDTDCIHGQGHYQDKHRLNVATSRAKSFTYFVYSPFPITFEKIRRYLNQMGVELSETDCQPVPRQDYYLGLLPLDPSKFESDFERFVYSYLERYINTMSRDHKLTLHNQVKSCGQKRLDFVMYNDNTKKSVVIEVDGSHHFANDPNKTYTEEHIERIEILTRAGWNIINTPYYKWWNHGWLSEEHHPIFNNEIERIYREIDRYIF